MKTGILSVNLQGASLHRRGNRVLVRTPQGAIAEEVPFFRLHGIWLFGSVEVTSAVIRYTFQKGPPILFFTLRGGFRGTLQPTLVPTSTLRIRQYASIYRRAIRLNMARSFLVAKIDSEIHVLRTWSRSRRIDLKEIILRLEEAKGLVAGTQKHSELFGIEGIAAKTYFEGYRQFFLTNAFQERNRRPPRDPVNALLSLGYTFLLSEVNSALGVFGLDPFLGYLHSLKKGKPSLSLDFMEPFRVVVDELIVTRLNLNSFNAGDFMTLPNGGVHLSPSSFSKFVKMFGERMIRHFPGFSPGSPSVRDLLRTAARNLSLHLRHENIPWRLIDEL